MLFSPLSVLTLSEITFRDDLCNTQSLRRRDTLAGLCEQCSHCNANATSRWVPGHMQYEGGLVCNACDHIYRHQHTYPTPEQNSTGVLTLVGQGVVFGFVPLLNALKDPKTESMTNGIWVLTGGVALSTLLVLCFRGRYRRYEAEQAFHMDHSSFGA